VANYLLVFDGGGMAETEDAQRQSIADWTSRYDRMGAAVVDGGNPISQSRTIASDGSVSEGGANLATGYAIIAADSLDAATELTKDCPLLGDGGSIEVAETFAVMWRSAPCRDRSTRLRTRRAGLTPIGRGDGASSAAI